MDPASIPSVGHGRLLIVAHGREDLANFLHQAIGREAHLGRVHAVGLHPPQAYAVAVLCLDLHAVWRLRSRAAVVVACWLGRADWHGHHGEVGVDLRLAGRFGRHVLVSALGWRMLRPFSNGVGLLRPHGGVWLHLPQGGAWRRLAASLQGQLLDSCVGRLLASLRHRRFRTHALAAVRGCTIGAQCAENRRGPSRGQTADGLTRAVGRWR
eukprot:4656171-Pyramimonas_sp.AAC.1